MKGVFLREFFRPSHKSAILGRYNGKGFVFGSGSGRRGDDMLGVDDECALFTVQQQCFVLVSQRTVTSRCNKGKQ